MENQIDKQKEQAIQSMINIEYLPTKQDVNLALEKTTTISLGKVAALGTAFAPIVKMVHTVIAGEGGSGMYYVNTMGKNMFQRKGQAAFIGSLKNMAGTVGGGQALLTPMGVDPMTAMATIGIAVALMSIEQKLDAIQETQQEMFDFLKQKEKTKLLGNLNALSDILNNYKFNWDNETYKVNKHIAVQEIKRDAEQSILLYREQIAKALRKRSKIHMDKDVTKALTDIQEDFKDYQLSLYLYSFSAFLEVMLLENFDAGYIDSVNERIEEYAYQYRTLYTDTYDLMEEKSKSTVQSVIMKTASHAAKAVGKAIEKNEIIGKYQLDENLLKASEKIQDKNAKRTEHSLENLVIAKTNVVIPFVENLQRIKQIYNDPVELYFDNENLYVKQKLGGADINLDRKGRIYVHI